MLGVDRDKVEDALEVANVSEEDLFEIEDTAYLRKADVDEDRKESRLRELKDHLATGDVLEAQELRQELEALEARIDERLYNEEPLLGVERGHRPRMVRDQ